MKIPLQDTLVPAVAFLGGLIALPGALAGDAVLTDTLDDFSKVHARSSNTQIVQKVTDWLPSADSRANRRTTDEAYFSYRIDKDLSSFNVEIFIYGGKGNHMSTDRLQLLVSVDGKAFAPVDYDISDPRQLTPGFQWYSLILTPSGAIPDGVRTFKVLLPAVESNGWWPIINNVELSSR
jgi:hypothetical protein